MGSVAVRERVDAAITYAKHAVNMKYEDLPPRAVEATKKEVLDTIATTIGGSAAQGCREVVALAEEWGGKPESTIFVHGSKVPAPHAAQVNAVMGHALDYDDTYDQTGLHPAITVVPVCFAMAERKGKVKGKEFLTAVALGVDLISRLALAARCHPDFKLDGWFTTQTYGYLSAAAAAAKILGLSEEQMVNTLGIAYQQAAGSLQCLYDGALTKRMGPGFATSGGIVAALMAEKGISGARNSLEGTAGLYKVYHRDYDPTVLTADLGKRFEGVNVSLKPWPCCRADHPAVDAILTLVKEHDLKPEDVGEVTVSIGKQTSVFHINPLELKRNPKTIVDAQFSIPWTVATALTYGKLKISNFNIEGIKDPAIRQMARKVNPKIDNSLSTGALAEPAIVEIRTTGGSVLSKRVDSPYGSPQNPMTWESIADKLRDCASWGAKPVPVKNLEKVVKMARKLEELDDVTAIIQLLS